MKLLVSFITYGESTAKYLPYFLSSLKNQTFKDFKIFAIDNTEDQENKNSRYIEKNYKNIDLEWMGENIGFARANNIAIKKAIKIEAEYILFLNPDMILKRDAIEKLIRAIKADKKLASVSPKVKRWIFKGGGKHPSEDLQKKIEKKGSDSIKTNIIDTCGITVKHGLSFFDLGENQRDKGQFDNKEILGPSGCAALYHINALKKIVFPNEEYFDELMFMYKEDCDLSYRLFLAGFKSKLVPDAVIYHDRTGAGAGENTTSIIKNRKNKSQKVKEWSLVNQHIIFLRYFKIQNFKNKIAILKYAFKMFIFVVLFERCLFKQYFKILKLRKKIKIKKMYI